MTYPVVLASASPRRQELLARLISEFEVDPADIDERALTDRDPDGTARRLARAKAAAVFERHPDKLVIAGDTVVGLEVEDGWDLLDKPIDEEDAISTLLRLAGRTHVVVTGVCLRWPMGQSVFAESSKVTFAEFDRARAAAYVATGEPMDKAGAYGLQGEGRELVRKVEGSVSNVIGLPTEALSEALRSIG